MALYQKGPSGGEESLREFVARTPGVSQVESLAFLRARFPEGGEVQARVDGTPFNTPWLSVLAASDLSLLPPQLGFALSRAAGGAAAGGAVLALVGPDIAIGKAFLGLQGARRFTLGSERARVHADWCSTRRCARSCASIATSSIAGSWIKQARSATCRRSARFC